MSKLAKKVIRLILDSNYRFLILSSKGFYKHVPDDKFLKKVYKGTFGRDLNLDNPHSYNEKLQWIKLFDHRPIYTQLVDKYEVKNIVSDVIGEKYIIPTIGVWDSFDDIDFGALPNQFVLKCTHDSGGIVICKDATQLDKEKARKKIEKCLHRDFYLRNREWPYKNVPRRIIAEKYMEDHKYGELRDYKFFCFDGVPFIMFIASDRQSVGQETKFDFFDMAFNPLNIINGHPVSKTLPDKPLNFELMKKFAGMLSKGFPQMRVDFYEVNGNVFFGEMTLFHHSGLCAFEPEEWDYKLGEQLTLPDKLV